jgi:hypothetical protein
MPLAWEDGRAKTQGGSTCVHTFTVQTKFTFGDRVRFDSRIQGCAGVGLIFAIELDRCGHHYLIETGTGADGSTVVQAGILEEEFTLLDPQA